MRTFTAPLTVHPQVVLKAVDQQDLAELIGMLILARIWRFLRIAHGLLTSM